MRKWIAHYRLFLIKLGTIFVFFLLYLFLFALSNKFSSRAYLPTHFSLDFPLPEKILKRLPVEIKGLTPEKVILAGFFSDWNPSDEDYRMRKNGNHFDFDLILKPGNYQYKYVLYYPGISKPIWVEDWTNPIKADDQFGGFNSVVEVASFRIWITRFRSLVLGILILLILYTGLIPILRKIYRMKLSFRIKMALSTILIVLFQSVFLYILQFQQKVGIFHSFFVEPVQIIHRVLESEGVDFMHPEMQKAKIRAILKKIIWPNKARIEDRYNSNEQSFISGLVLYSDRFIPLVAMNRLENEVIQQDQMKKNQDSNLETYLDREFFRDYISKIKKNFLKGDIIPIRATSDFIKKQGIYYRQLIHWFPYKGYLIPIFAKHRIAGYYGVIIHPYVFARKLKNQFFFYLLLLFVTLTLSFLLSFDQGGLVIRQILRLKKWTDSIKKGHFDIKEQEQIRTGDELQDLATNFDQMRLTLNSSLKNERKRLLELEELKIHLEDLVEERTKELSKAVEQLKYNDINIQNELGFASAIQRGIMPSQECQWNDFQIYSYSRPLQKIGGDFLDIMETRDQHICLYMADVSGHGIPSAFITALLKSSVISILQEESRPIQVMRSLNTKMQVINSPEQTSVYSHYFTMFYIRLRENGSFDYTNCAHPNMLLYRNEDNSFSKFEPAPGTVVGILDAELFRAKEQTEQLEKGDIVFLFTDGLIEQRNEAGEELEFDGLKKIVFNHIQQGFNGIELMNLIIRSVLAYAGKAPVKDDISLMILKRRKD